MELITRTLSLTIAVTVFAALTVLPGAWLVMLNLGNFGHGQFGLIDCLPAGALTGLILLTATGGSRQQV